MVLVVVFVDSDKRRRRLGYRQRHPCLHHLVGAAPDDGLVVVDCFSSDNSAPAVSASACSAFVSVSF